MEHEYLEQIDFLAHGLCTAPRLSEILQPSQIGSLSIDAYKAYLPRFQAIWAAMRQDSEWRGRDKFYHASILDAGRLKLALKKEEIEIFASTLYAHGLFAQSVHGILYRHGFTSRRDDLTSRRGKIKENTFPRVNGILSTIDRHICPAIMPTMLLYIDDPTNLGDEIECEVDPDAALEFKTWAERIDVFDQGVANVIAHLDLLLPLIAERAPSATETFERYFSYNHEKIKLGIKMRVAEDRVINHNSFYL